MNTILRICRLLIGGLGIGGLFLFLYFECEFFYKDDVEASVGKALEASVTIGDLEMNFFSLRWIAKEVSIVGPEEYGDAAALGAEEVDLDIAFIPWLLSDTLRFETLSIKNPLIIFRIKGEESNLRALQTALETYDWDQEIHRDTIVKGTQVVQINRLIVEGGQLQVVPPDGSPQRFVTLRRYDIGPIGRGQEQSWADLTGKGLSALEYFVGAVK